MIATTNIVWLRIPKGKSHAVCIPRDNDVEFWCGKGRNYAELLDEKAPKCPECLAYLHNTSEAAL